MTRNEAIKTLHELWRETNDSWYEEVYNMAIEALKNAIESPNDVIKSEDDVISGHDKERSVARDIATIIENEQDMRVMFNNADRQKWIPCSERLPSESGRYLVTYLVLRRHIWVDVIHFGKPSMPNTKVKGKCWYRADEEWGDVVYDDILAWMPLPEPYKGGDEE